MDANPGDGIAADADGNTSLRAAVMEANALAGDDTIYLPAGTYTRTLGGLNEGHATTGDLDIRDDVTILGAGAADTIIEINTALFRQFVDQHSGDRLAGRKQTYRRIRLGQPRVRTTAFTLPTAMGITYRSIQHHLAAPAKTERHRRIGARTIERFHARPDRVDRIGGEPCRLRRHLGGRVDSETVARGTRGLAVGPDGGQLLLGDLVGDVGILRGPPRGVSSDTCIAACS